MSIPTLVGGIIDGIVVTALMVGSGYAAIGIFKWAWGSDDKD